MKLRIRSHLVSNGVLKSEAFITCLRIISQDKCKLLLKHQLNSLKLIYNIPFFTAAKLLLGLFSLVFVFHLSVVLGWLPSTIVWGGRIQTQEEFYTLESVSLLINTVFMWVVAQRGAYIKSRIPAKGLKLVLWAMAGLYALNTLGNLMAIHPLEKYLFTPLTLISAVLCLRLALEEQKN
jgi:hypothetical protein